MHPLHLLPTLSLYDSSHSLSLYDLYAFSLHDSSRLLARCLTPSCLFSLYRDMQIVYRPFSMATLVRNATLALRSQVIVRQIHLYPTSTTHSTQPLTLAMPNSRNIADALDRSQVQSLLHPPLHTH